MTRTILSIGILFISCISFAQKEDMTGKWIEQRRSFIDTLDAGRDLVNAEYEAYKSGQKKLESNYIIVQDFITPNLNKLKIEIWKENGSFWTAVDGDLKNKFLLEPQKGKYFLRYFWNYLRDYM